MIFLGIKLKDLRLDRNISQRELAKNIGFSQAAIARWEKIYNYLLGLEDWMIKKNPMRNGVHPKTHRFFVFIY